MYAYAANNPIKYTDPDGRFVAPIPIPLGPPPIIPPPQQKSGTTIGEGFYQMPSSSPNTIFPTLPNESFGNTTLFPTFGLKRQLTLVFVLITFKSILTLFNKAPGTEAIPESDKDSIAEHSADGGHGYEVNLENPTKEGIKQRIDEILTDPKTMVKTRKRDGAKLYMSDDGTALIHNEKAEDKGTIYVPDNPERMISEWK